MTHLVQLTKQTGDNTEGVFTLVSCSYIRFTMLTAITSSIDYKTLELLEVLTPLEPLKRHEDVKVPRSVNAGTWLLGLESFSKWRDSQTITEDGRVFCCYGIPGAGKTVMRYYT